MTSAETARRNVFRKNTDRPRFLIGRLVEQCGRYGFDQPAMGLKFSKQVPLRASPAISQVAKRGSANLALHNLLSIPHRKLERHQVGIIPNGLSCPQRHEPGPFPNDP